MEMTPNNSLKDTIVERTNRHMLLGFSLDQQDKEVRFYKIN